MPRTLEADYAMSLSREDLRRTSTFAGLGLVGRGNFGRLRRFIQESLFTVSTGEQARAVYANSCESQKEVASAIARRTTLPGRSSALRAGNPIGLMRTGPASPPEVVIVLLLDSQFAGTYSKR